MKITISTQTSTWGPEVTEREAELAADRLATLVAGAFPDADVYAGPPERNLYDDDEQHREVMNFIEAHWIECLEGAVSQVQWE
jgi:hypothetical protein